MASMELTLRDLSDRVGIEPRTIRSYIEKGLLPGPEGAGRSAAYSERHLNRLRIIKVRKDRQGWTLEDIRRQLLGMTELETRALAEALSAEEEIWTKGLDQLPASPLEYVQAIQARRADKSAKTVSQSHLADAPSPNELRRQMHALRRDIPEQKNAGRSARQSGLFGHGDDFAAAPLMASLAYSAPSSYSSPSSRPHRGTKAKLTYEIEITPDVLLVVKGLSSDDEFAELKLRRFEAIAERLRELLSSPSEDIEELVKRLEDLG